MIGTVKHDEPNGSIPDAPATIHQMWIWLVENRWQGIPTHELDDVPTEDITAAIDAEYEGGVDQFFVDHPQDLAGVSA